MVLPNPDHTHTGYEQQHAPAPEHAHTPPHPLPVCLPIQQVEPIALLANSPETGFVGVYMYCDDQATLKHLPTNMRATQIAGEAGQALQVGGCGCQTKLLEL